MKGVYLWPLLGLIVITPFTPWLDLEISNSFYTPSKGFESTPLFSFLYQYGFIPADATAVAALIAVPFTFLIPCLKRWRAPALVLVLTLAIGAGLIIHGIFKDHWGRPRPKQTIQFGGSQPFRPYYQPNFMQKESAKSFPCGHCSTGFYFFALAFIGRREKNEALFWIGLILAFGLGILLSLARIAQGGHYFSDTLVSALIMWVTAAWSSSFIYQR